MWVTLKSATLFSIYSKLRTMKDIFSKLVLVFVLSLTMLSCGPGWRAHNSGRDDSYSYSMKILFDRSFTMYQFDSLCVADTIPPMLDKWKKADFYDYETNQKLVEYYYIKRLGNNESFYRLLKEDEETYNILKRVVYGTKKED